MVRLSDLVLRKVERTDVQGIADHRTVTQSERGERIFHTRSGVDHRGVVQLALPAGTQEERVTG
jgi:hypothetical protein